MRLSDQLLQHLIEIECPSCNYPFEIQLVDARTQVYRLCPCCRTRIRLVDAGGSMFGELEAVDNAFDDLERTVRMFE